jgi:uncharacterized protein
MIHTKIKKSSLLFVLFLGLLVSNIGFAQFKIPPKPDFQTSVYDYANILDASQKAQLEEKLIKYSDSTTTQIVVITVNEINGEDIGILTPRWAQEWGIGDAKKDNGVLILLAKTERKIWIAPGYGVEDRLIAGINGEIIRNIIIPEFKTGNFYGGLDKGSDAIFQVLKGKYKGTRVADKSESEFFPILVFIIIFVVIMIIASKKNGGNSGNNSGGGSLLDVIILSSLGRNSGGSFGGGGFGGSSGGGGFGGGFGGGGFSGGGAGGSW